MDYLNILLEGYLDENNRRHLDNYFFRRWKEAEKNYYTVKEFFIDGCLHEIHKLEYKIRQQVNSHKLQLENYIRLSSDSENIKIWKKELEEIHHHWKTSYTVSLSELPSSSKLTNEKYTGGLSWEEIQFIKGKIEKGISELKNNKQNPSKSELTELSQAFEKFSKYKKVMEILVSKGFIYPHTYKWKYKKSGFKSLIFAFLKDMEGKDYFKEDVKLNYDLCKTIALNTFGIEIKSNKTFYNSVLPPDLDKIIPPETARN